MARIKNTPSHYEIRVRGHLGSNAAVWFSALTIRHTANGDTSMTGPVVDQAALHGLLMRIRDLGLPLILVRAVEESQSATEPSSEEEIE